ncbi:DNA cytosine methyltransferase [Porphyromonas gingivalis]|uniref:DNA cytosine methyltransferase n=1 Tax=Porphyromonas gingivalis TaxID=837 RepID=UPI0003D1C40C|nr:DNA (cytosine-5-)-methyltransferase [Porphyromonas gingivalis]ETA25840.1 DNA-cytosine methyltransferase [Porphyromonas gingivalis SJD2]MDP0531620.1 DNA cytosine methyltransferase [Porphyromonas gingivalis]MDP0624635.1 DNA cytosine methyltransferase [Porphyromonas gingivalis]WKD51812.1 DNA cytosine methyltransferase [Porphyromonas gingivalis]WKD53862.1 DNA cytosine methyltransferase [Porphyromonas gingivalis]
MLTFIDLFAGAGGLSEGFIRAGYTPLAHIEMDKYACDTLKTRAAFHWLKANNKLQVYKKYLYGKQEKEDGSKLWEQVPPEIINSIIHEKIDKDTIDEIFAKVDKLKGDKQVDIIIGGPPCQAYSVVGRARDPKNMKKDPRNFLYKYYLQFLKRYKPRMFVFENVPGILSAKNGVHLENIKNGVDKAGYEIELRKLRASDYGVLQNRERIIIIGWKKGLNLKYPKLVKEHNPYKVLPDLFSDLPERQQGQGSLTEIVQYTAQATKYLEQSKIRNGWEFTTQHVARPHNLIDMEIYKRAIKLWIDKGERLNYANLPSELQKHNNKQAFLNRFQVVNHDGFCHTVVAHIAMDGHYYIYPSLKQVRSITVREAARIQSFPDDYFFEGSRSAAFKQIGNAVPVVLAHKIAEEIKKMLI